MRAVLIIWIFLIAHFHAICGHYHFSTTVSKEQVATGERFQITFSLNGSGSGFTPPSFDGFQILSGPNQSSSMEWINGSMSSSLSYSYILLAVREGTYTIGPAKIKTDEGVLSTKPVTITVIKGAVVPQQQPHQNQQGENNASGGRNLSDDVFIRLITDKTTAYIGEQIYATYKLYYRVNIVDYNLDKLPAPKGFWTEEIKLPQNIRPKSENINGVIYNTAVFKKAILFPQQTGDLQLEPMEMDLVVRIRDRGRPRSIFDQFFGNYKDVKYTAKSNAKTIRVKPLPVAGKPGNFTGAVGDFAINARINKSAVKTNDAINLKFSISGNGNLKLIQNPKIEFPPDFEVYDPKVRDHFNTSAKGVTGKRTFEYLVIPRVAGHYSIDPIQFVYFNPKTKSYSTLQTGKFEIDVSKGEDSEMAAFHSIDKEDLKVIGKDIRFIKTGPTEFRKKGQYFFKSARFFAALFSPLILFLFFVFIRRRILEYTQDTKRVKRQMATRWAKKRLSKANNCMKNNDTKGFYAEVSLALYGYISDKLSIDAAEMSREKIRADLMRRKVSEETIDSLFNIMDLCEMARFSPMSARSEKDIYKQSLNILTKIEKEIR